MSRGASTPWGPAQTSRQVAEGITRYDTASHGGYEVEPKQNWKILELFPDCKPYGGFGWYEEDCDWCYVALAYPAYFNGEALFYAVEMAIAGEYLKIPATYWQTKEGKWTDARVRIFRVEIAGKWRRGSLSTNGDGWNVSFSRAGECQTLHLASYPEKSWYSDAELDALVNPARQLDLIA